MSLRSILTIALLIFLFTSCKSKQETTNSKDDIIILENKTWVLDSWKSNELLKSFSTTEDIQLLFNDSLKQLYGIDGCNRIHGKYTIQGDSLKIGALISTKKYCGKESSEYEKAFHAFLQQTIEFKYSKTYLQLKSEKDLLLFKVLK